MKFKTDLKKVSFSAKFLKKIYNISSFLNKRYDFDSDDIQFDQGFEDDDKLNGKITIRLIFNEKK